MRFTRRFCVLPDRSTSSAEGRNSVERRWKPAVRRDASRPRSRSSVGPAPRCYIERGFTTPSASGPPRARTRPDATPYSAIRCNVLCGYAGTEAPVGPRELTGDRTRSPLGPRNSVRAHHSRPFGLPEGGLGRPTADHRRERATADYADRQVTTQSAHTASRRPLRVLDGERLAGQSDSVKRGREAAQQCFRRSDVQHQRRCAVRSVAAGAGRQTTRAVGAENQARTIDDTGPGETESGSGSGLAPPGLGPQSVAIRQSTGSFSCESVSSVRCILDWFTDEPARPSTERRCTVARATPVRQRRYCRPRLDSVALGSRSRQIVSIPVAPQREI